METGQTGSESHQGESQTVSAALDWFHLGLPSDTPWFFRVVLGSRGFLVATVVVTVVLGAVAASNPEWLLRVDEPVSEWFRATIGDNSAVALMTHVGSPNLALVLGVVGVAASWRRCRASAITLGVLVASATAIDITLKLIVDRPRPSNPLVSTGLSSFPSGHVIHAVVIFGLLPILLWALSESQTYLKVGFAVFSVAVTAVAVSRVALGTHWPSDVVGSFFIGASLLLGAQYLIQSAWAANQCSTPGAQRSHGVDAA